jgi:hypothetical protein
MGVPNIGIDSKGSALGDVRFGSSEADISVSLANVRFTPVGSTDRRNTF